MKEIHRNKLHVTDAMDAGEIVRFNQKYFDRAARSVEQQHDVRVDRTDLREAAELYILSIDALEDKIQQMPFWKKKE